MCYIGHATIWLGPSRLGCTCGESDRRAKGACWTGCTAQHDIADSWQISIAGQTIFCFASGLAKISIVLSYLRIATPKSKFRYFTWAALGVIVAALCIFIIVLWTQCIPAHKYWDLFDNNRHCVEEGPPLMGQIAVTILTDILVYVLPMPTLVRLNLPWSQRIILLVVFGFGAVVVVAGIMRLYYVHLTVYETYDVTWVGYNLWIWTAVEVNLGIICGCVPALKPLAYKARTKISSSNYMKTHSSSSRKSKSYNRSNVRSSRPLDIELEDETTMVSKQGINVEKTIEWSQSDSTEYDASFHKTKHADHGGSWLEDGPESSQTSQIGQYGYGNSAEITRSSFGLKR